jgi:hypothetical protein
MRQRDSGANGRQERRLGPCTSQALFRLPAVMLAAGLTFGAFPHAARGQDDDEDEDEVLFEEVRIILETNATDCDTGLQLFFDGDPWKRVNLEAPNGTLVLHVRAFGPLRGFGLTEQFNETNEPVMAELVEAFPELECDEPEFTLEELFELFPEGVYEFEGRTVEGDEIEGEATLSHVIPAPPELVAPAEDAALDSSLPVIIEWNRVDEPILDGLGREPDDSVDIVGFQVIVEREDPAPLVVFTADLPADATQVTVPPEFLEPGASYKFEVLQIDVSGNQTIAESSFETEGVD